MDDKCMLNKRSRNCEDFSKCHKCGWNKDVFAERRTRTREKIAREKIQAELNRDKTRKRRWVFIEL